MAPTLRSRAPKPAPPAPAPAAARAPLAKKKTSSATGKAKSATAVKADEAAAKADAKPKSSAAKAARKPAKATKAAPKATPKAAAKVEAKPAKRKAAPRKKAAVKKEIGTGALLDHEMYAHIFDLIVSYAPHGSLLALRGASKALCERVDLILAEHVVLRPGLPAPKGKKWAAVVSISGLPGLPLGPEKVRQKQFRCRAESLLGRLPGFACDYNHVSDYAGEDCSPLCLRLRQRWEARFARTKVLDLHWARENRFERQRAAFTDPALVVRVYPRGFTYHPGVVSERLVVFTSFTPAEPAEWGRVTSTGCMFADEKRVRRMVFNVAYDVRRPSLNNCWVNLPTLGISVREAQGEIVLIFSPDLKDVGADEPDWLSPEVPETQRVNPAWEGGEKQRQNGWLWDVANLLRCESPAFFTVVGATEVPYMCVGLEQDIADKGAKEDAIMDNIIAWIDDDYRGRNYKPGPLPKKREKEIRNSVQFFTLDEYREEVGERQWRIETEPTDP